MLSEKNTFSKKQYGFFTTLADPPPPSLAKGHKKYVFFSDPFPNRLYVPDRKMPGQLKTELKANLTQILFCKYVKLVQLWQNEAQRLKAAAVEMQPSTIVPPTLLQCDKTISFHSKCFLSKVEISNKSQLRLHLKCNRVCKWPPLLVQCDKTVNFHWHSGRMVQRSLLTRSRASLNTRYDYRQ